MFEVGIKNMTEKEKEDDQTWLFLLDHGGLSCTQHVFNLTHGNLLLYLVCPVSLIKVTCPIFSMLCISNHGYLSYSQYIVCPLFMVTCLILSLSFISNHGDLSYT